MLRIIIKNFNPKAVYTVEEVKLANAPHYPIVHKDKKDYFRSLFHPLVLTTAFSRRILNKVNYFQQSNHLKTKTLKETF